MAEPADRCCHCLPHGRRGDRGASTGAAPNAPHTDRGHDRAQALLRPSTNLRCGTGQRPASVLEVGVRARPIVRFTRHVPQAGGRGRLADVSAVVGPARRRGRRHGRRGHPVRQPRRQVHLHGRQRLAAGCARRRSSPPMGALGLGGDPSLLNGRQLHQHADHRRGRPAAPTGLRHEHRSAGPREGPLRPGQSLPRQPQYSSRHQPGPQSAQGQPGQRCRQAARR